MKMKLKLNRNHLWILSQISIHKQKYNFEVLNKLELLGILQTIPGPNSVQLTELGIYIMELFQGYLESHGIPMPHFIENPYIVYSQSKIFDWINEEI